MSNVISMNKSKVVIGGAVVDRDFRCKNIELSCDTILEAVTIVDCSIDCKGHKLFMMFNGSLLVYVEGDFRKFETIVYIPKGE